MGQDADVADVASARLQSRNLGRGNNRHFVLMPGTLERGVKAIYCLKKLPSCVSHNSIGAARLLFQQEGVLYYTLLGSKGFKLNLIQFCLGLLGFPCSESHTCGRHCERRSATVQVDFLDRFLTIPQAFPFRHTFPLEQDHRSLLHRPRQNQ